MKLSNEKVTFITGATSGIGAAFARRFAREGYDLIITGRREKIIRNLAGEISKKYGVKVDVIISELSNDEDVNLLVEKIKQEENIEVLINNAGFGIGKPFYEDAIENQENMAKVHILSTLKLTYAAIPNMIKKKRGIIINVSSISSFFPLPDAAIYSGTKAFLNNFSESIYLELKNKGIYVQSLCPGFTRTDFHNRMGLNKGELRNRGIIRWMSADRVVEYSIECLKKGKIICIPGFWNKVLVLISKILPRFLYYKIVIVAKNK